jgi:hypothetical protein
MTYLAAHNDTKQAPIASSTNSTSSQSSSEAPPSHGSYDAHPFKDAAVAQHWRDVYENAKYEGRHHFDPNYTWSAAEEKRLVRKVSVRQGHSRSSLKTRNCLAGSAHHTLGLGNVLRARIKSQKHKSSNLRQHVERPEYAESRLHITLLTKFRHEHE